MIFLDKHEKKYNKTFKSDFEYIYIYLYNNNTEKINVKLV